MVDVDGSPATGGALATLARTWDVTNIDPVHGRFRKIKAAGDGGRRLTRSGFGAHFSRIACVEN